jgi:hypothetical protein
MEQQYENTLLPVCYKCQHYVKGELICAKTNKIIPEGITCDNFDLAYRFLSKSYKKD